MMNFKNKKEKQRRFERRTLDYAAVAPVENFFCNYFPLFSKNGFAVKKVFSSWSAFNGFCEKFSWKLDMWCNSLERQP